MQIAPDGRVFVCEQAGRIRIIKNGALLSTPFATLQVDSVGERGLLGIAFDPSFATTNHVYVYYTTREPNVHNRVSRLTANGDVMVPGSEVVLFESTTEALENHLGGALDFGTDGKLYIAVGDNSTPTNAQSLSNIHGKLLRINRDGTIPTDNPFYSQTTGNSRAIWALGLRNPFTFAVNRSNGLLFVNDVGQQTWEEIDEAVRGANFGWPDSEGPTSDPRFRTPRYSYMHGGEPWACAITGGAFYAPTSGQFPADYANDYFFGDYCGNWIRKLDLATNTVVDFATGIPAPVDVKVDNNGSLYYLARGMGTNTGAVYRVDYGANNPPTITSHPTDQTVAPGASVTFSVRASGAPTLRYQWRRNGVNISGATLSDYTIPSVQQSDSGAMFSAVVSNNNGSVTSNSAVLVVSGNQSPTATITQPAVGSLYSGGGTVTVNATATDPEDGTLPASAFTWQVVFHHDTHTHPFIGPTSGMRSGSFQIPTTGETSANVWYRVHLTVVDSDGQSHAVFRDVMPRVVRLTLTSTPATGLELRLDGQPVTTPHSFDAVVGIVRSIQAVTPQTVGGATYAFASWSDNGAATHNITTPAANTTYTANYTVTGGGGASNGLTAAYYNNADFTGTSVTRIDDEVDFTWSGSPAPGIDPDTFSVRWTGQVQAQFTETYTFYTESDNGVRLWVNGQLLIDNWSSHTRVTNSATIALVANQRYSIRIDFWDNTGYGIARLGWSSPSTPVQVIPTLRLSP